MNYDIYLFGKLLELYDKEFAETPYDIQYDTLPDLYKDFETSKYNRSEVNLYDCIINYLLNKTTCQTGVTIGS